MIAAGIGALVLAAQAAGPTEPAAAPAAAAAPAKVAKAKDDPQKIVCKTETVVGSLIPKRICLSQENWDAMSQAGKSVTDDIQRGALQRPPRDMSTSGGG
jgi:hypothetical protein